MTTQFESESISCRKARNLMSPLARATAEVPPELQAVQTHLEACVKCEREYRGVALARTTLEIASCQEAIVPDELFFRSVRARIARGPARDSGAPDESWSAALMLSFRQLIPAMAVLLLLMIGASLIWKNSQRTPGPIASSGLAEPTADDEFESLVAVEEKDNGR